MQAEPRIRTASPGTQAVTFPPRLRCEKSRAHNAVDAITEDARPGMRACRRRRITFWDCVLKRPARQRGRPGTREPCAANRASPSLRLNGPSSRPRSSAAPAATTITVIHAGVGLARKDTPMTDVIDLNMLPLSGEQASLLDVLGQVSDPRQARIRHQVAATLARPSA